MARSEVVTSCDCGCGKQARPFELERWFTLSQYPEHGRTAEPKLGREGDEVECLHFASIACLQRWASGALKIIPKMARDASSLHPRGGFYTQEFPTLWF